MSAPLDAGRHNPRRGGPSFSLGNRLERVLFTLIWRGFAWIIPPPFGWGWRRSLLRLFGARIGRNARVYPSVRIWLPRHLEMGEWATLGPQVQCYNMARVAIGPDAIISQRAFLCAGDHDLRDEAHQLVTREITVSAGAWVAAEAFVGPGVSIGSSAVLGARACVTKDVPPATVWTGNPARQVSEREMESDAQ